MITLTDAPAAKADRSSESEGGHYYEWLPNDRRWVPLYEEGGTFNLRNARKLKAAGRIVVPSVTSVLKLLRKAMLEDWLIETALKTALRMPRAAYASDEEWVDAVRATASRASSGAMDLGTQIHAAVEAAIKGESWDVDMDVYVQPTMALREKLGLRSIGPEACVGSLEHGYAGRVDDRCEGRVIVDLKSRKTAPGKKVTTYSTDRAQTSSYGVAEYGNPFLVDGRAFIFVISTTEPGRVEAIEFSGKDLTADYEGFVGLCALWRAEKKFDPRA